MLKIVVTSSAHREPDPAPRSGYALAPPEEMTMGLRELTASNLVVVP